VPGVMLDTKRIHMSAADGLKWLVRARGHAKVQVNHLVEDAVASSETLEIDHDAWKWHEIPAPPPEHYGQIGLSMGLIDGALDLDVALLMAGEWKSPSPGDTINLPAGLFFHAGYTDPDTGGVVFEPQAVPAAYRGFDKETVSCIRGNMGILYGPRLPLESGVYDVDVTFASSAQVGTTLGGFYIRSGESIVCPTPVEAGAPARARFVQAHSFPVTFNFLYSGKAPIRIESVRFTNVSNQVETQ
jgi:hypothetical protein